MKRTVYRGILWLHPPAFRREFAEEMLWIFDQAAGTAALWLLFDGLASLARQWLLRSGAWKLPVAAAGALFQITAGGLGLFLVRHIHSEPVSAPESAAPFSADMKQMIYLVVWAAGCVICGVIFLTLWVKRFTARRIRQS